jgi:hypothetical protein
VRWQDKLLPKLDICGSDGELRVKGEIVTWLKKPGDTVCEGETLCIISVYDDRFLEKANPRQYHYQIPDEDDETTGTLRKSAGGLWVPCTPPPRHQRATQVEGIGPGARRLWMRLACLVSIFFS